MLDVPDVSYTRRGDHLVGSTEHAAEIDDRAWRQLLEQHHALVQRGLSRCGGVELDTAGSGTVRDLVAGSGFASDDRGERELKGVPGSRRLYAVVVE